MSTISLRIYESIFILTENKHKCEKYISNRD